jgi:N-acetyl sugar amidotransferase
MSTALLSPRRGVNRSPRRDAGYRICRRCIMDTSDPEITFSQDGLCCHCCAYQVRLRNELFTGEEAKRRLRSLVEKIKAHGRRKEHDCIIGVSGGVDSTMVAFHVRQLGLRPLAVHLDNGWNSELAVDNIRRTLETLNLDLYTHVIDWDEFRDLQLSFLKASVPNCEIPTDHAINAVLINTALKRRIRFILTGSNLATEGIMPVSWGYHSQDLKHLRAIHRRFGSKKLTTFPQLSLLRYVYAVMVRRIKYIPILNLLNYNKLEAKQLIKNELGWRDYGGKHHESLYTKFFQNYLLPEKFGFDKRRAHLSTLVCSGQLTREHALEQIAEPLYQDHELAADREYVIKKFRLNADSFDELMSQPIKKHFDYPSHNLFFYKLEAMKRIFKRIATTA